MYNGFLDQSQTSMSRVLDKLVTLSSLSRSICCPLMAAILKDTVSVNKHSNDTTNELASHSIQSQTTHQREF